MRKILLALILFLPFAAISQSVGYLRYDTVKIMKQGGVSVLKVEGAAQLTPLATTYTSSGNSPTIGQSFELGVISADANITFLDLPSNRRGTFIFVKNANTSANTWNVIGNVKNPEDDSDVDTLSMGLHIFWWTGVRWDKFNGSGGVGSGGVAAKVAKFEIFKNEDEFRATTSADTGVLYQLRLREKYSVWKYVPADVTSTDDTCTIIVSGSGKRYYRQFGTIITPEDFKANGDDAIDDTEAFHKMVRYIQKITSTQGGVTIHLDPKANYRIAEGAWIDLPFLGDSKAIIIEGQGAKMTCNTGFRRRPAYGNSGNEQGMRVIIKDVYFTRTGTQAGSKAIDIGATYNSKVENCSFVSFDTALVFRFALNSVSQGNYFVNNLNGIYIGYGLEFGGSTSNSQSNGTISESDRIFNADASDKSIIIESASDCEIRNIIIEGFDPNYGIYFDDRAATVVEDFKLHGAHFETVGPPQRAYIYFRGSGYAEFTDIYVQTLDTFLIVDQTANLYINLRRMAFFPSNTKFASTNAGTIWNFEGLPYGDAGNFMTDHFVNGGDYVLPNNMYLKPRGSNTTRVQGATNSVVGFQSADITSGKGFFFQPELGDVRVNGMHLRWGTDNAQDIGNSSTTRPRNIYAGTAFVADGTAGSVRWNSATGTGWFGGTSGVMRAISGSGIATSITGGTGVGVGTTAQRPSSPFAGIIRAASDSVNVGGTGVGTGFEGYNGTTWRTFASRLELINTNTLIQTQISAAGFTDKFTLTTTGSRTISAGQTVYEIHLKSTASITVDIGTSAAGTDIADDFVLASGVTRIISFIQTADSSFDLHWTYVSGTGNIAVILVKRVL